MKTADEIAQDIMAMLPVAADAPVAQDVGDLLTLQGNVWIVLRGPDGSLHDERVAIPAEWIESARKKVREGGR